MQACCWLVTGLRFTKKTISNSQSEISSLNGWQKWLGYWEQIILEILHVQHVMLSFFFLTIKQRKHETSVRRMKKCCVAVYACVWGAVPRRKDSDIHMKGSMWRHGEGWVRLMRWCKKGAKVSFDEYWTKDANVKGRYKLNVSLNWRYTPWCSELGKVVNARLSSVEISLVSKIISFIKI